MATSTVSSLGVGSGLDLSSLLTKLMQAERTPLNLLNSQNTSYKAKISAYGSISSKLSTLQTAASSLKSPLNLEGYKATSTDTTVLSATTSSGAAPGTYNVHIGSLASAHTLVSAGLANATSAIDGNASENEGKLRIGVAGSTFDVSITSSNNSLNGIRDAINGASNNTGVTAAVVTDATGARLTLTSKNTGSANTITLAVDEGNTGSFTGDAGIADANSDTTGLSKLAFITYNAVPGPGTTTVNNLTKVQDAANASLTVNSIPISSASNTVSGAIYGVTLNLAKAGDATLSVTRDTDAISKLVSNFVSAYNDVQSTTRGLSNYDSENKTGNLLTGDGTARTLLSSLAKTLQTVPTSVSGAYKTLSDLGISVNKDGSLSTNSAKLQTAITTDFTSVKSVLMGYGTAVSATVDGMTSSKGLVTSRVTGLNSSINMLGERAEKMSLRLASIEARYRRQFTALDTMVSQMNQTSNYLTQQLAKL